MELNFLFSLTPFFFYAGPTGISHKDRKSKLKIGFRNFRSKLLYYIFDFFKSNRSKNKGGYNMINLLSQSGHQGYGIKEYVLDTIADLDDLPVTDKMGSTAFIISTS